MIRGVIWQLCFGDFSQSEKLSEIKLPLQKSHEQQMTSLTLPLVPQMFVPLILTNHGSITGTYLTKDILRNGQNISYYIILKITT